MKIIFTVTDDQAPKVKHWINGVGVAKSPKQRLDLTLNQNNRTHELHDIEWTCVELADVPKFQIGDVVASSETGLWGQVVEIDSDVLLVRLSKASAKTANVPVLHLAVELAENLFP